MSLFYGKKDDNDPYPDLDHHAEEPKSKSLVILESVDNTFKPKHQPSSRDSVILSKEK